MLSWLQTRSGDSWQQRWRASGAEDQPDWRELVTPDVNRAKPLPHLSPGLLVLICADVIRPSQQWLLRFAPARRNLAAKGGPIDAVRVGDCVELREVAARMRATSEVHAHSPLFYQPLRAHGVLSEDAPAAIEMFSGRAITPGR